MNIIEAVKSGKPFRRKGEGSYYFIKEGVVMLQVGDCAYEARTLTDIIIDNNWELIETSITITESQFDEAWEKYSHKKDLLYIDKDNFKKELGF